MNTTILPMTTPTCDCCDHSTTLLARRDVADGLWVCPESGQMYRVMGDHLLRVPLPTIQAAPADAPAVRIDLSRSSYA